jgi:hypothetical protein
MLGDIRRRFKGAKALGIGDKVSDAVAYHENGLRAMLIVQPDETAGAAGLRQLADSLDPLPDVVQVVTGWREIERVVFGGATFPKTALQARLRKRADELEAAAKPATP